MSELGKRSWAKRKKTLPKDYFKDMALRRHANKLDKKDTQ